MLGHLAQSNNFQATPLRTPHFYQSESLLNPGTWTYNLLWLQFPQVYRTLKSKILLFADAGPAKVAPAPLAFHRIYHKLLAYLAHGLLQHAVVNHEVTIFFFEQLSQLHN